MNDRKIVDFSLTKQDDQSINSIYSNSQRNYIKTVLTGLFDFTELFYSRNEAGGIIQLHKTRVNREGVEWSSNFFKKIDNLNDVSNKFKNQLSNLVESAADFEADQNLQDRVKQASVYFETEIKKCIDELKNCPLRTEHKESATELNDIFQLFFDSLFQKHYLLKTLSKGFVFSEFVKAKLKMVYPEFKINVYSTAKNTKVSADVNHPALFRKLLLLRDEICNEEQKPIYMVANNKALTELTNFLPVTEEQLTEISGFGKAKAEAYGDQFLKIIRAYMLENELESNMASKPSKKKKKEKKTITKNHEEDGGDVDEWYSLKDVEKEAPREKEKKTPTKEITYRLFRSGKTTDEIAKERGLTLNTIQTHLIPYVANGEISIDNLVPRKKQNMILKALENFKPETGLNPIKASLPDEVTFSEIKYVLVSKLKDV
jgi:hypothetical protein